MAVVGFVGSRSLGLSSLSVVGPWVRWALSSGRSVAVGCAVGADSAVMSAVLSAGAASSCSVFAVGGSCGAGFWRGSAPLSLLSRFPSVVWWAGGPSSARLVWRLSGRSRALVRAVAAGGPGSGLVAFVSGGPAVSPGSWRAVRAAVSAGVPVVVVPVGCGPSHPQSSMRTLVLPVFRGGGAWVALSAPCAGGFRWLPASAAQQRADRDLRLDQRAEEEGPRYIFDGPYCGAAVGPSWSCFNPVSGRSYIIERGTCTCLDYQYHREEEGYRCKHLREWSRRQEATTAVVS